MPNIAARMRCFGAKELKRATPRGWFMKITAPGFTRKRSNEIETTKKGTANQVLGVLCEHAYLPEVWLPRAALRAAKLWPAGFLRLPNMEAGTRAEYEPMKTFLILVAGAQGTADFPESFRADLSNALAELENAGMTATALPTIETVTEAFQEKEIAYARAVSIYESERWKEERETWNDAPARLRKFRQARHAEPCATGHTQRPRLNPRWRAGWRSWRRIGT